MIAFGGDLVADGRFFDLTHDLNLLAALGVQLVLVHGARPQIEARLKTLGHKGRFHQGLRVTDEVELGVAKEASGRLRGLEALPFDGAADSPRPAPNPGRQRNFSRRSRSGCGGVDLMPPKCQGDAIVPSAQHLPDTTELLLLSPLAIPPGKFQLALEDAPLHCRGSRRR